MNLIQCFQTHSTWYKGSRRNGKPVGVLWHDTAAPKEQKNEQKDGAGTETPKTQTNIIVEPQTDNLSENSDNTSNGNDAIHDEPLAEELSDETYIHSPEEAQNFIVRLLNHIISFIMKLFKK